MRMRAAVLAKLNLFFVVVHVHANNFGLDRSDAMRHKFEHVLGYKVPITPLAPALALHVDLTPALTLTLTLTLTLALALAPTLALTLTLTLTLP